MDHDGGSDPDRDLLARLNALKQSTVELKQSTFAVRENLKVTSIDPLPARALHTDLLDRFKSLSGNRNVTDPRPGGSSHINDAEDDKTIEDLLADLGPAEQWDVGKSEKDHVEDLLRAADNALRDLPKLEQVPDEEKENDTDKPVLSVHHQLPAVDVSVFQPEPESDDDKKQSQTKAQVKDEVNQEAEDVLKRLMDEVKYEQKHGNNGPDDQDENNTADGEGAQPSWDLPSAPSKALPDPPNLATSSSISNEHTDDSDKDIDLASRFANLGLPSVPTALKDAATSTTTNSKAPSTKFTDEEVDSWCIICSDDATLSCLGCDEDLYCLNCWMEGHRGEDAGMEERRHRAVEFSKGKKKKQQLKQRRGMVGA